MSLYHFLNTIHLHVHIYYTSHLYKHKKQKVNRNSYLWGQVDLHGCVRRPVAHSEDVDSKFYVAWLTLVLYILGRIITMLPAMHRKMYMFGNVKQ